MKRLVLGALTMVFAASFVPEAANKSPTKLKAEFDACLPTGMMAQMVWSQMEGSQKRRCLYVVNSRDCIIRKLTGDTIDAGEPQITFDGTKVVFQDYGSGKWKIVNWDGTGCKSVYNGSESLQDYWHNSSTNVDYGITYSGMVNLSTGAKAAWKGTINGDDGIRISADGAYVACDKSGNGGWAIMNISTGAFTNRGSGGCVCNISPDNLYSVMVQQTGHTQVKVTTTSGTTTHNLSSNILSKFPATTGCGDPDGEFQQTRWIHPDYVTFPVGGVIPGPFLVKLKDNTKWVAVQDTLGCALDQGFTCSSVDARIATSVGVADRDGRVARSAVADLRSGVSSEAYSLDGRRIKAQVAGSTVRGVVIRRVQGEATAVRTVVMPK